MSFEPTILIRKSSLEEKRDLIEYGYESYILGKGFRGKNAKENTERMEENFKHLQWALNTSTIKFPEIELVLIEIEFTSRNESFRALLDELKIDYRLDY